jgi:UDP-N-acetylglucosamine:LPS N-acetylglucosamine transferase
VGKRFGMTFMKQLADQSRKRVLAVASGGGHWVQLLRVAPAFADQDVAFVTVNDLYREEVPPGARFYVISDATRWNKLKLVVTLLRLAWIMMRERPHVVISTGAAPGYLALRIGRILAAKTIWIDSMANVDRMSMAGEMAGKHADLWLTQWPELARSDGPHYKGAVI